LHPVGILFSHINDNARSKSHKIQFAYLPNRLSQNLAWTCDNQTPQFIYSSRWCKHGRCEKFWGGSDSGGNV